MYVCRVLVILNLNIMLTHNIFQCFTIFVRCFTISSQIGCLALKSPSSSNGISLCFSSSRSSLCNISESLGGMYSLPIRVCFPFISTRFQIASRFDCTLLTKTLLISFFIRVATPNPSFFSVKVEWSFLF